MTFIFFRKSNYTVAAWISQRPLLGFKSCLIRHYNKELTDIYSSLDEWLQGPAELYEVTLYGSAINTRQRARSQEGAARGLVPCLRAHWGKFMEKQRGTCPADTALFIVLYSLKYALKFQDNTLKLLQKDGENLQFLFQEGFRTMLAAPEWYSEAKSNHFVRFRCQTPQLCVLLHISKASIVGIFQCIYLFFYFFSCMNAVKYTLTVGVCMEYKEWGLKVMTFSVF